VLPAAVSLRKQGANKGAVTSFLISTPESGVDSIAISYALLDPLLTVIRPLAAFMTALAAGIVENLTGLPETAVEQPAEQSCPVDGCCDGSDCQPECHSRRQTLRERIKGGLRYAFTDLWDDLAVYFFAGILLAGVIAALVPESFFTTYLGGGLSAMLIMLVAGIPLYICATASTPVAAALILKGVSPGAALVFLLAGPATNMASLAALVGTLGKRSTAIYLAAIGVSAVFFGLGVDALYHGLGISAQAVVGHSSEQVPYWLESAAAVVLLVLSLRPLGKVLGRFRGRLKRDSARGAAPVQPALPAKDTALVPPECGPT
jgi:uncharacterized membrane protein YraQ (UPF0718 family)